MACARATLSRRSLTQPPTTPQLNHSTTQPLNHSATSPMDAALFGLIVADLITEPMALRPPPGGLNMLNSIQLTTGGNVCNTGVAIARLGMRVAAAKLVGTNVLSAAV